MTVGPAKVARDGARARHHVAARRGRAGHRPRRPARRRDAARDGPRLRDHRQQGRAHGRLGAVPLRGRADPGPDARPDHHRAHPHPGRAGRRQHAGREAGGVARPTRSPPSTRCAACSRSAPASARTSAVRPRARPAPPATTRTPGSPASRRSAPRPSGSATCGRRARWTRSSRATPVSGGTFPAVAWKSFMNQVHQKLPVEDWPGPPSVYSVPVLVDRRYGTTRRAPYGCRYARELVLAADKAPDAAVDVLAQPDQRPRHDGHDPPGGAGALRRGRRRDDPLRAPAGGRRRGAGHGRRADARRRSSPSRSAAW